MGREVENEPLVSVVIPSYNHERFVRCAIKSVIEQDYCNIELIIIDDGSKDNSTDEINKMLTACENRFTRFEFRSRENKGLCETLNEGIEWCQGEFYSAIASDDLMYPQKTRLQVNHLLNNPSCVAVFGGVSVLDDCGNVLRSVRPGDRTYTFDEILLQKHCTPAPTQMMRLSSLRNAGAYPRDVVIEDWYMWLKLSSEGARLDCLGDILAGYRRHGDNLSKKQNLMNKGRRKNIELFKGANLYKKAILVDDLLVARSMIAINRFKSVSFLLRVIVRNPSLLTHIHFFRYIVVFCLPKATVERFF